MKRVPFFETCSCNPINGGNGVCGCTMANKLVEVNDNWPNNSLKDDPRDTYKFCPHCGKEI